jgi:membrane carboxypeptidase/penicillin-binding protein
MAGVVFPALYFYYAKDLPDLSTSSAIRGAVASTVEGERRGTTVVGMKYQDVRFELWPVSKLPKAMVSGVLAMDGCPDYLTARKERGFPLYKRLFTRWFYNDKRGGPGPGRCQLAYADMIASAMGAIDPMHATIADHHILSALDIEDLLAYRVSATYYAPGVIGAHDASQRLFKKDLDALSLSQIGELLASDGYFPQFSACKNPGKLKLYRDAAIDRLEGFQFISSDEANAARAPKMITCQLSP